MKPFVRLAGWWKQRRTASSSSTNFDLACVCGQTCQGQRQRRHQVVRCSRCNRELFVLPLSPLPAVRVGTGAATAESPSRPLWLVPLLAGGVTFLVMVALFAAFWDTIVPGRGPGSSATRPLGTA